MSRARANVQSVSIALLVVCAAHPSPAKNAGSPCSDGKTKIVVVTNENELHLCRKGRADASYDVAIGSKGSGKNKRGDHKTPLGRYRLGKPRASKLFYRFIPVGYPTAAQKKAGYTGSAIGVHGPKRGWKWLGGWLNTSVNWTQGCVAVGSDDEIVAVQTWVKRYRVVVIELW